MKMRDVFNLSEAVLDIDEDVEYVFEHGGFRDFLEKFKRGDKPFEKRVEFGGSINFEQINSTNLPSSEAKKASLLKPVEIFCGILTGGSSYNPSKSEIKISFNYSAVSALYGDYAYNVPRDKQKTLVNEITDFRIKASISHELSHWISDVKNNNHLSKILFKAQEFNDAEITKLGEVDVNFTYFEIDAQIHALLPIHKKYIQKWDSMTLEDIFDIYPSLRNIHDRVKRYGQDISEIWQKKLINRMNREGILGKSMRKFVK